MAVRFSVRYEGKLAGEPYEVRPELVWWSSADTAGLQRVPVQWKNEQKQISEKLAVSVPVGSAPLRPDDHVWVEVIVKSPTNEGMYVGARAGSASISMLQLRDAALETTTKTKAKKKKEKIKQVLDLKMPQLILDGAPYSKGRLKLTLLNSDEVSRWEFAPAGPYDLVKSGTRVNRLFNLSVAANMFPYGREAERMGLQYRPSSDELESLHAPVWTANVPVPGWAYWTRYSTYAPDETFAANLVAIALARHGIERRWFIETVDAQLERTDGTFDENFVECVVATVDACAIPAVSLYYKSDESYVLEQSRGWFGTGGQVDISKRAMESFNDALVMNGDDCEGLGAVIHRVARMISTGDPAYRGAEDWYRNGSWRDPVLRRCQRVLYWYVSGGGLGDVTAARVSGSDGTSRLVIDSEEDRAAKIGGHMWQESIPVPTVEELSHRTNLSAPLIRLRPGSYPGWLHRLPHTVGEGTGAVYPLLRPIGEYYTGEFAQRKTKEFAVKLELMRELGGNSRVLRLGQVQRVQQMLTDEPDARLSNFYRRTSSFYTDDLFARGYPVAEFVWTQLEPRQSEQGAQQGGGGSGSSSSSSTGWTWGANMRDKLRSESANGTRLGMVIVPPLSEHEMGASRSLIRQLPPLAMPRLSPGRKRELEEYARPVLVAFQRAADEITAERRAGKLNGRLNVIYRRAEFFKAALGAGSSTSLRSAILDDVRKMESIYKTRAVFEAITDNIYNVRLELYMNAPDDTVTKLARNVQLPSSPGRIQTLFGLIVKGLTPGQQQRTLSGKPYYFSSCHARDCFRAALEGEQFAAGGTDARLWARGQLLREELKNEGFSVACSTSDVQLSMNDDQPSASHLKAYTAVYDKDNGYDADTDTETDTDDDTTTDTDTDDDNVQKVHTDEHGSPYMIMGLTFDPEELEEFETETVAETMKAARVQGYTSHVWITLAGTNPSAGMHLLYLFQSLSEARAFLSALQDSAKRSDFQEEGDLLAFERGSKLSTQGIKRFKDPFFMVVGYTLV